MPIYLLVVYDWHHFYLLTQWYIYIVGGLSVGLLVVFRQLFVMYDALPEPSLKMMNSIVSSAVNICTAVYLCVSKQTTDMIYF